MVRRREFLLLSGAAAALCSSCSSQPADAEPEGAAFFDTFDSLDQTRWTTGKQHMLGRSTIMPANVQVVDEQVLLELSGDGLDGAELRTVRSLPAGTYRARIQLADVPDSVTGFFLYSPPDFAREVDIELYNRRAGRARLTTYNAGKMTRTTEVPLSFDPTTGFHEYAIALTGQGVEFYADGTVLASWSQGVPRDPMNLYINAWYPQWLGGVAATGGHAVRVDAVRFDPR